MEEMRAHLAAFAVLMAFALLPWGGVPSLGESEAPPNSPRSFGREVLLADPARNVIYEADSQGDTVRLYNGTTGELVTGVPVGASPQTLALTRDGASLFVAIVPANEIVVVDPESATVRKRWGTSFTPLTLAPGRSGRLYVGQGGDGTIHVVDTTTGRDLSTVGASWSEVGLQASPDGTRLLVWTLGSSPLKLSLYDVATDTPALLATDDHDLEAHAGDVEVDWARGIVYLTSGWGIERVSLPTLDRMARVRLDGTVVTLALSPDGAALFGLDWDGNLHAYDAPNASFVRQVRLGSSRSWLEVAGDGGSLFAAYPFERLSFPARVETELWTPGGPLCFSPERVSVGVVHGIPRISFGMASLSLDGRVLESSFSGVFYGGLYDTLEGTVPDLLPEGTHEVRGRLEWDGTILGGAWTFTINTSVGPPACPYVSGGTPWGLLREAPTMIEVPVWRGDPSTEIASGEVRLDGGILGSWFGGYEGDRLFASVPAGLLEDGVHEVQASIAWRGGTSEATWSFILDTDYSIPRDPLEPYAHPAGFRLLLPSGWTRNLNVTVEGEVIDLVVIGPSLNGIVESIVVDTGADPTVRETTAYLWDQVNGSVEVISQDRPGTYLDGPPTFRSLANHSAAVFVLRDSQSPTVQEFAFVVSEAHARFWILLLFVHSEWFLEANATFQAVLASFEVEPAVRRTDGPAGLLVFALVGGGAGAAVLAAVWLWKTRHPSVRAVRACARCGTPAAPQAKFCGSCGQPL